MKLNMFHLVPIFFCFLASSASSQITTESAADECFQPGACEDGDELYIFLGYNSQEECLEECRSIDECNAFTYDPNTGMCYAYSSCPIITDLNCSECVSGIMEDCPLCQQDGACTDGSVITGSSPYIVQDEQECYDYCQITPSCMYYTYSASSNTCILYSSCNFDPESDGSTSERDCPPPGGEDEHCFEEGACTGDYTSAVQASTPEECLQYCQDDALNCNYFTWYPTDPPHCETYTYCPVIDTTTCPQCVSGAACDCECDEPPPDEEAFNKFLIALGRDSLTDVEVADLPSALGPDAAGHTTCQKPANYPLYLETAVAALIDDQVVICGGGFGGDETYRDCYTLNPLDNRWENFGRSMQLDRAFAASVIVPHDNTGWWVIGGFDDINAGVHVTTERYDEGNRQWIYGPNLPAPLYGHCAVQTNEFTTLIIGGDSEDGQIARIQVYSYNWIDDDQIFDNQPMLNQGRESPACGVYKNGISGESYVVVAGGIIDTFGTETYTTELLPINSDGTFGANWISGPNLPFSVTGATILEDGDDLILVGGDANPYVVLFKGDSWEIVEGVQLDNGNRLFSPALVVPDMALTGCIPS